MARVAKSLLRSILFASLAITSLPLSSASAQTTTNPGVAGIDIDAEAVLHVRSTDTRLRDLQLQAARKAHKGAMQESEMRKVSLNRLESSVADMVAKGQKPDQMMTALAGITRLEHVIYLPESKDIVVAGPAEEIFVEKDGRVVGLRSGKPCLRLDDLIVALRAYRPTDKAPQFISCSIDPTQDGLVAMADYLNQHAGISASNLNARRFAEDLKSSLGLQTVSIEGVPLATRFALTLTEADYRMKLIGIGLENPGIKMRTWIDRVNVASSSANSLQRWYFVANYDDVKVSPDGNVLQLAGQGVKLVGESERVGPDGSRAAAGKSNTASDGFTTEFTAKFEQIAQNIPVFHEMRNLFDLSVAAAYIREQKMYESADWNLGVFDHEDELSVETSPVVKQVEPAVNVVWKGSTLTTPIGGGVQIESASVLKNKSESELTGISENAQAPEDLPASQWWWD